LNALPPNGFAVPLDPFGQDRARRLTSQSEAFIMRISSLTWSRERIEQLKHCFNAGLTCSQIAREIGVTRNAVIGKLNRLGLSQPRDPARTRRAAKPARPGSKTRWRPFTVIDQRKLLRDAFPQVRVEDIPIHNGRGCTLLELAQDRCRWPINDPGAANFCYCGNEASASLPYCTGHARLAYRGVSRRSA
jgi:GcrA cell cycle regulator